MLTKFIQRVFLALFFVCAFWVLLALGLDQTAGEPPRRPPGARSVPVQLGLIGRGVIDIRKSPTQNLHAIAEGLIDVEPLVSGRVGLDGVAGAFHALGDPEGHVKVLVDPALEGTQIHPIA